MSRIAMLLFALLFLPGCAQAFPTPWGALYGIARDERSVVDIATDKAATTEIKAKLMDRDRARGLAVKVYCFRGRVTLLGRLDDGEFRIFALRTAQEATGVREVEVHWEPEVEQGTLAADLETEAFLRATLVADEHLSSTQIEIEVFSGKVYLLGLVRSRADADRAVSLASVASGVTQVVSLLAPGRED